MSQPTPESDQAPEYLSKASLSVALAGVAFLTPFALNHVFQGNALLGAGSLVIVAFLVYNVWTIRQGHYRPALTLLGFAPLVIVYLMLTLSRQGIIGALWCYPAVISFYFMLPERKAWVVNLAMLVLVLPQVWLVIDPPLAARVTATLLTVSAFAAIFIRIITGQQQRLHAQAVTDPLTGLFNRMLLRDTLEKSIQQGQRSHTPMTLIAIDLDHFKAINDSLGHDAGDIVLRGVADLLRQRARRTDSVFRLGGEELLMLLYDTNAENGLCVAEGLRSAIAAQPFLPNRPVTASFGVATLQTGENYETWIKRSDENLYRAKLGGRNRVMA